MSNNWHANHGAHIQGTWSIRCDVKGCGANLSPHDIAGLPDAVQRQAVRLMAEANGWYVAQDKLHANKSWDLCPEHAPPNSMNAPSTRLLWAGAATALPLKKEKP